MAEYLDKKAITMKSHILPRTVIYFIETQPSHCGKKKSNRIVGFVLYYVGKRPVVIFRLMKNDKNFKNTFREQVHVSITSTTCYLVSQSFLIQSFI
jgi:hypothetical protein